MASKKEKQFLTDARKLSDEQLRAEVESQRGKLYTLRTQAATEKVEDLSLFRKTRRNIARLLTEQTARRAKATTR
ncbi:MAG: 50S ribosomal protein L29 [Phycisphaerales bacterium]